ncbi:MAG: hypothetical protein HFI86_07435 [Bacilli bacterium]|nr:hypothetical protein [Bacilli bacterium]
MKNFFIKRYIDKLTMQDIKNFANSNNINLNDEQLYYIFNLIKNDWKQILNNDTYTLNKIKEKFDNETSKKIEKLYYEYKKKYQNYLS